MWDQSLAVFTVGAGPGRWAGTWLVAGAALLLAVIGRRRLPVGVSPALLVAGLSGALLAVGLAARPQAGGAAWTCAILTALAVVWHLVLRWCERLGGVWRGDHEGAADLEPPARAPRIYRDITAHAVLVFATLVAGISLWLPGEASLRDRLGVSVCLLILAALALPAYFGAAPGRYASLGLLGCAWRLTGLPALARVSAGVVATVLVVAAGVALLTALGPILGYWRYRRRVWRSAPERLTDPPTEHRLWGGVLALAGLIGVGALLVPERFLAPIAVFVAALAAFIAGHRQRSDTGGELGLALLGEGVVIAAVAWLPTSGLNALLGGALAGSYLLWLARFWQQQLHEGRAWTTAGRLIPAARRLGYAAAVLCCVLAVAGGLRAGAGDALWSAVITTLLLLLLWSMLVSEATRRDSVFVALLAGLTLLAAMVPARLSLAAMGVLVPWPALAGAAALLLALRAGPQRTAKPLEGAYNAYIGGVLPLLAWYAVVVPGAYDEMWFGLAKVITVASLLPALALRWRVRRPAAPAGG